MPRDWLFVATPVVRPIKQIIAEVAERHGVRPEDVIGPSRPRVLVDARVEAYYEAVRERSDMTWPAIARVFKRDHSTLYKMIKQHCDLTGAKMPRPITAERRGRAPINQERDAKIIDLWNGGDKPARIAQRVKLTRRVVNCVIYRERQARRRQEEAAHSSA